jgi:hypothetical protein
MNLTLTHNNIEFVDAQAMRIKYPATFGAPSKEDLEAIKAGDHVKICVNDERFWVKITGVNGDIITGRIDNDVIRRELKFDDIIEFPNNCVFQIGYFSR